MFIYAAAIPFERIMSNDPKLTSVNCYKSKIGDEEVKKLCEALKHNIIISAVDLSYNKIGDEGARSIADFIRSNNKVLFFSLRGNFIGEVGKIAIRDAVAANHFILELAIEDEVIQRLTKRNQEKWIALEEQLIREVLVRLGEESSPRAECR